MSEQRPKVKTMTAAEAQSLLGTADYSAETGRQALERAATRAAEEKSKTEATNKAEWQEHWADGADAAARKPKPGTKIKPPGSDPNSLAYENTPGAHLQYEEPLYQSDVDPAAPGQQDHLVYTPPPAPAPPRQPYVPPQQPLVDDPFTPQPQVFAPGPDPVPPAPRVNPTNQHQHRAYPPPPDQPRVRHNTQIDPELQVRTKTAAEKFLDKRARVTIELNDGTFSIPIVAIKRSKYCVTIFTPLEDGGMVFVPKPGSELTISSGEQSDAVYYPGTYTEVTELGIGVMHLIKADQGV